MLFFSSEVMSYFNAATPVFQNKRFPQVMLPEYNENFIIPMYSSEILMCVNVLPYLLGKYYQLLQTQFKLLFTNLWKKATLSNLTTI
jgi:hypothetical protein